MLRGYRVHYWAGKVLTYGTHVFACGRMQQMFTLNETTDADAVTCLACLKKM